MDGQWRMGSVRQLRRAADPPARFRRSASQDRAAECAGGARDEADGRGPARLGSQLVHRRGHLAERRAGMAQQNAHGAACSLFQ